QGTVKCWGQADQGQTGSGTQPAYQSTPADVAGLGAGATAIAAGSYHACALTNAGSVMCWGRNDSGQLGNPAPGPIATPVEVQGLASPVKAIAAGTAHTCAVLETGDVMCWGGNDHGELGDGTTTARAVPAPVVGLSSGAAAVALGVEHTCALLQTGGVECW